MKVFLVHADSWRLIALITVHVLSDDGGVEDSPGREAWSLLGGSSTFMSDWTPQKTEVIILDSRENRADNNPVFWVSSSSPGWRTSQNNRSTNLLTVNRCEPGYCITACRPEGASEGHKGSWRSLRPLCPPPSASVKHKTWSGTVAGSQLFPACQELQVNQS